jgi:hypothetical protein
MLARPAAQSPGDVRGVDHLLGEASADPLVAGVRRDDLDVAAAQCERGLLLPLVGEPVDLVQRRCVRTPADEEREGSTCVDGLELVRVADQQDLGAPPAAIPASRSSVTVSASVASSTITNRPRRSSVRPRSYS